MFHNKSLVELDYGGLANYLDHGLRLAGEEGLAADTSVEDVLLSLDLPPAMARWLARATSA